MSRKSFAQTTPEIADYVIDLFQPIDAALCEIINTSERAELPGIQVGPMDGRHLEILARAVAPLHIIEIGTLGGYSGLCLARGLQPGGTLSSFEKNEKHARIAEENLKKAIGEESLDVKFEIYVGPALDNLTKVEHKGPFDLVFIDADKPNYSHYFKWAEKNLRIGGMVIADNTFAWGEVHKAEEKTGNDKKMVGALAEFNLILAQNPNFRGTIFPTEEGLTVGVKIK